MKILTIIVSYNFEKWIDKCLGSLQASEYPTDIIVIDNKSQDNTVSIIKDKWKNVRLIASDTNLGFGKANNIGMCIAIKEGYDAVFLLNQDAWIDKETISVLAKASEDHHEYGILSPIHMNGNGEKPDKGFAFYAGIKDNSDIPHSYTPTDCKFINAAIWFIRTSVIKEVGGFSPLFYHYGEDKDYVNRVIYHGYKVGYISGIKGYHDREYRAPSRKIFLHSEYVYHLSEYSNINRNITSAFTYGVMAVLKKAALSLVRLKIKDFIPFVSISARLLLQSSRIIKIRNITKTKHPNFIS